MTKRVSLIRWHVIYLLLFVISTLTISYLIIVSSTTGKDVEIYKRIFHPSDVHALRSNFELMKGQVKISDDSSQMLPPKQMVKVILIWSPLFEEINFLFSELNSFKNFGCVETRCEITFDRKRLLECDAILFHVRTLSMFDLPRNRTRRQKWIFFSLEAPPYSRFQGFDFMVNMFNWTMTYRRDSDIVIPYGRIVSQRDNSWHITDWYNKWKNKTKMAVWMVSHCFTDGNREEFIKQLGTFFDIDIYGACGFASCPSNKTELCVEKFSKHYYFFLAFENAICDDYITEKLFRTLRYDMIPVVFGGGDYSSIAPSNSFIDALKFSSPKQLAKRMIQIASNFTEFLSYFQWRCKKLSVDKPDHCELCHKLHSADFEKHSAYSDIDDWWVKKSKCKRWKNGFFV